jgi:hypothetical protein
MFLVLNHEIHYRLYASIDHERNRHGYQKIVVCTLNGIHKRMINKVMVEYSEVCDSSMVLRVGFTSPNDGEIFSRTAQCYDVCHRLAGHTTKLLVTRTSIIWIE